MCVVMLKKNLIYKQEIIKQFLNKKKFYKFFFIYLNK